MQKPACAGLELPSKNIRGIAAERIDRSCVDARARAALQSEAK
jgi:hypothetical protein